MTWKNDPKGMSGDNWLDVIWQDDWDHDGDFWYRSSIKLDGCIHFYKAANIPFSEIYGYPLEQEARESNGACDDYIHICDITDFINKLVLLREKAKQHFNSEWG